ncbi:MAG: hypothetical protein Q7S03_03340 [bacterium]|nr:hypothetical protein [bacterium]
MTDTNNDVQKEKIGTVTPVAATEVVPTDEKKAVAEDGATSEVNASTEVKPEENKAE